MGIHSDRKSQRSVTHKNDTNASVWADRRAPRPVSFKDMKKNTKPRVVHS